MSDERTFTAFAGQRLIVSGDVKTVLLETKEALDAGESETVLIFEDKTGVQVDFDFRGTPDEVVARLSAHPLFAERPVEAPQPARSGPGRPSLGVVSREVSLLPRHWEWLAGQPGGISGTLRRLVDTERKRTAGKDAARQAWDAAGKFMWTMAGNLPGFEEASRTLYAKDTTRLDSLTWDWPPDIRNHLMRLVYDAARLEEDAGGA